jgi:hypothetical protein
MLLGQERSSPAPDNLVEGPGLDASITLVLFDILGTVDCEMMMPDKVSEHRKL